jgi:hypothetical protein
MLARASADSAYRGLARLRANSSLVLARRHRRRRWLLTTGLLFGLMALWGLATPIGAAPDEPTQLIKAAAVVRGELTGTPVPGKPTAVLGVRVPEAFARMLEAPDCYIGKPARAGSCAPAVASSGRLVHTITYVGRYPPLYYFVVGLPSLPFASTFGMHLMRLLSALLSALFLASAFESALCVTRSRTMVWGVAAAATPMALWLAGMVNPNGLEITSATCLWASGAALACDDRPLDRGRLLARAGIAATVLVQCRGLSLLWLAVILACLAACAKGGRLADVARAPAARAWGGVVGASCLLAIWWLVANDSLAVLPLDVPARGTPVSSVAARAFGSTYALLHQMVGLLGSADVPLPTAAFVAWLVLVAVLVLMPLRGPRRILGASVALIVVVVVLPALIETARAGTDGLIWQGRYTLPLAVGIPILASAGSPPPAGGKPRWIGAAFSVLLFVALADAYLATLRRYAVGAGGAFLPFGGSWEPPLGAPGVTLLFLAVLASYSVWLRLLATAGPLPRASPARRPGGTSDLHGRVAAGSVAGRHGRSVV